MHIIGCLKTFFTRPWVRAIQSEKLVMPIDLLFAFGYVVSVTSSNDIRSTLNCMFRGSFLYRYYLALSSTFHFEKNSIFVNSKY